MLSIFLLWILLTKYKNNQEDLNVKRTKLIERGLTGTIILTVLCIFSFYLQGGNVLATEKQKIMGKEMSNIMKSKGDSPGLNKLDDFKNKIAKVRLITDQFKALERDKDSITDEQYQHINKMLLENQ